MPGQLLGSMISAVFGLIYVLVNTSALSAVWVWTLRGAAAAVFAAVLVVVIRASRSRAITTGSSAASGTSSRTVFGWRYWGVVGLELVALFVGTRLLSGPLDAPQAGIAWVSLVVGTHFFALAVIFAQPFFHWLGAAITICGTIGIVLALVGAATGIIGLVAGVVPGALLLAFGSWGALRKPSAEPARAEVQG